MHAAQFDQFKQFDRRICIVLRSLLTLLFVIAAAYVFSRFAPTLYGKIPSWLKWGVLGVIWWRLDFRMPMPTAPEQASAWRTWCRTDQRRSSAFRAHAAGVLVLLFHVLFCAFPLRWLGVTPSLTFIAASGVWLGLTVVFASELWSYHRLSRKTRS